ncbi:uncharacterized protein LOC143580372 [Bidens hawaiensis]|uniref:uncharacterized protein LOC143580372 n=1 Tax=Bidens hawaiensis TaxID=980011 RepID=UPI0040492011
MALVLRYVDKLGLVKKRFIGLVHVKDTTALSLKHAIDELFARYNLSLTKVRGQGYDGAGNMAEVTSFCEENEIEVLDILDQYVDPKCKRKKMGIANCHYYEFENFNTVLDMQIQDLGNRFNEVTTELLMCMGSLSPDGNFSAFNEDNMLRLAKMYQNDFSYEQRENLKHELRIYIANIREDKRFFNMNGISTLAKKWLKQRNILDIRIIC